MNVRNVLSVLNVSNELNDDLNELNGGPNELLHVQSDVRNGVHLQSPRGYGG